MAIACFIYTDSYKAGCVCKNGQFVGSAGSGPESINGPFREVLYGTFRELFLTCCAN